MLPELLPTPSAFNHVILRVEMNEKSYWVDPTFRNQGGSLENNYLPNYHWGLILSKDSKELTPIPKSAPEQPIEIDTFWTWTSNDIAELKVVRNLYGSKANQMRDYIEWKGIINFSEESLNIIRQEYEEVVLDSPFTLNDYREENKICIIELYKISTHEASKKKSLKYFSITLKEYLDKGINHERNSPYALWFPLFVKEHSHIKTSCTNWTIDLQDCVFENEYFRFTRRLEVKEQGVDIYYDLEHLKDHVPVKAIKEYWNIIKEIDSYSYLTLTYTAQENKPSRKKRSYLWIILVIFCILKILLSLVPTHR